VFVNRETPAGRVQTCVATGHPLPVASVPDRWRAVLAWSLVPVAAEVDDEWASTLPDEAHVSLGWQGLLRRLVAGQAVTRLAPTRTQLVARADIVGVSRHDLAPGTRPAALLSMLHDGARLVVTEGLDGGRAYARRATRTTVSRRYGAVAAAREVDPTGAGDVFLAALLAATTRSDNGAAAARRSFPAALRLAATAASFVVEAAGLDGVPTLEAVLAREKEATTERRARAAIRRWTAS
jgi:hypothetical protein